MVSEEMFCERLAALRAKKGVSARDMSLSLGQSASYINNIENKHSLPSISAFLYICEYLGVTPKDFFTFENAYPEQINEIVCDLKKLDGEQMSHISAIIKSLVKK